MPVEKADRIYDTAKPLFLLGSRSVSHLLRYDTKDVIGRKWVRSSHAKLLISSATIEVTQ